MKLYQAALSALLIAPIVGGASIQMMHGYRTAKEKAEQVTETHRAQIEQTIQMIDDDASDYEEASIYTDVDEIYDDVQEAVIRFHVRANSDSAQDQLLKQAVKNEVLQYMQPELENAASRQKAKRVIESHIEDIQNVCETVIAAEGYDYPVKVYLDTEDFPLKSYGDLLFPSGQYEALRIDIGDAEGANWWCVLYPSLCYVDTAGGIVAVEGKDELRRVLTQEEYETLLLYPETEVQYESYFLNLLKGGTGNLLKK